MAKLAVISDIHDNVANLKKVLEFIKKEKIGYIICTGDVQSMECWQMLDNLDIPIYAVLGNVDQEHFGYQKLSTILKKITLYDDFGEVELVDKKILFSHYPEIIKKIVADNSNKYDLALYGHTHKPWEEIFNNIKLLNPGNVGNFRFSPTFAIIDLENLRAKLILVDEIQ